MEVVEAGHVFRLKNLDDGRGEDTFEVLTFVNREDEPHAGTTNQEVLRALISRIIYLNDQMPHILNGTILYYLRMALVLHEMRALERKVETGKLEPELVAVNDDDGHFSLAEIERGL